MRKNILILLLFVFSIPSHTQSIFNENFETTTNLISSGWKLYNDGNIPNNGYDSIFIHAWEIVDWAEEIPNLAVSTTSTFIDPAPANRWLVTPQITIPSNASNIILSFKARSFDVFPRQDGFKVKISTTSNSKASFTTTILSISNAPNILLNSVTTTEVDLSAYAGQSIYLAWIDDFENGNILAIDDIDVSVNSLSANEFNSKKITVYPNPSKAQFYIDSKNSIKEIKIYDMLGKTVSEQQTSQNNEIVNTNNLLAGIYLLTVTFDDGTLTKQRLIIQ